MLLHFPAVEGSMTQMNVVDTESCPHILTDMVAAAFPQPASMDTLVQSLAPDTVEVFESGIYTVVLATDATAIPGALDQVPKPKRPALNDRLFDWYSEQFPGWPVALCCFANRDARRATPMLWWYEPRFPGCLFAPAIDSHTCGVPDLNHSVDVDHRVVFGIPAGGLGAPVGYSDRLPEPVRALLPFHVTGVTYVGARLPNADFVVSVDSLDHGVPTVERRVLPAA